MVQNSPGFSNPVSRTLNYATTILVLTYFVVTTVYTWCTPRKTRNVPISNRRRKYMVTLGFITTLTYGAECLSYLLVPSSAPEQSLIHSISQVLLWMFLTLVLNETTSPVPMVWIGTSAFNLLLEALILILSFPTGALSRNHSATDTSMVLQIVSFLVLFCFTATASFLMPHFGAADSGEETRSLLKKSSSTSTIAEYGLIGSDTAGDLSDDETVSDQKYDTDSDSDDSDDEEEMRISQKQRLENDGGWIGYLSAFKGFLPYLVPSKSLKHQVYLLIMLINLILMRILNVLYPRQMGIVIDKLAHERKVPWKELFLWYLYGLAISNDNGLGAVNEMLENRMNAWSTRELMSAALNHVMSLSMSFHDSKDSGEVIKAIEQAGSLSTILQCLALEIVPAVVDVAIAFWYLTHLFDIYAMFIAIAMVILYVFSTYRITVLGTNSRRVRSQKERGQSKLIYESVGNWFTVSCFNQSKHTLSRLSKAISDTAKATLWNDDVYTYIFAANASIEYMGRIGVTVLAANRVAAGTSSIGSLVTLESYWDTITRPIMRISWSYRQINSELVDAERLLQLFQISPSVKDKPNAQQLDTVRGDVVLDNVEYSYHGCGTTIRGLDISAKPGETVALVGETGSGKSTTFKLLMRFYDVTGGSIKIDGQDIRDVTLDSLREIFGLVPQDATLFNMSILENVRYGRLNATDTEIFDACRAASIHDKILSLPHGYASKVGERGVKLSGGERQRIAIARVFLKDPSIVLLDEATSALDSQTESKVQAALKRLTKGRTTFVIAHRLSTVLEADKIVVIHDGKAVECGTHAELLKRAGKYHDLWNKQAFTASSDT